MIALEAVVSVLRIISMPGLIFRRRFHCHAFFFSLRAKSTQRGYPNYIVFLPDYIITACTIDWQGALLSKKSSRLYYVVVLIRWRDTRILLRLLSRDVKASTAAGSQIYYYNILSLRLSEHSGAAVSTGFRFNLCILFTFTLVAAGSLSYSYLQLQYY